MAWISLSLVLLFWQLFISKWQINKQDLQDYLNDMKLIQFNIHYQLTNQLINKIILTPMKSFINSQQRPTFDNSTQASPHLKSKRSSINKFIINPQGYGQDHNFQNGNNNSKTTSIFLPKYKQTSITQRQIYSHDLISSIMRKRQARSIAHQVGHFDPDIQLYSKPIPSSSQKQQNNPELNNSKKSFNSKNSKTGNFQESEYSQKIHSFNGKLNEDKLLSQRIQQLKRIGLQKAKSLRPKSAQNNVKQNNNKRISVSGLVTYDFQSVNARKNLGFKMENDQDQLKQQLANLTTRNKCCNQRHQAIMNKKSANKAKVQGQIKKAIFSDFQTETDNFLKNLKNEIKKDQKIYGQKVKKLNCIKQLMRDQHLAYNQAQQIIQIIQKKKPAQPKLKVQKVIIDQQKQLNNRKQVQQKNRVMLKQLYFSD